MGCKISSHKLLRWQRKCSSVCMANVYERPSLYAEIMHMNMNSVITASGRALLYGTLGMLLSSNRPVPLSTLSHSAKHRCFGQEMLECHKSCSKTGRHNTLMGFCGVYSFSKHAVPGEAIKTDKPTRRNERRCHTALDPGSTNRENSENNRVDAWGGAVGADQTRVKPADRVLPRPFTERGAPVKQQDVHLADDSQQQQDGRPLLPYSDGANESSMSPLDVLYREEHFAVVCKPPLLHVHRPEFGSRDKEFLLQKARNQLGQRVYPPHRLDRGTSGCLLLGLTPRASKILHEALVNQDSIKTYVAVARGSGKAFVGRGWFTENRPIKDETKTLRQASTRFLFVKGGVAPGPRCCLVLAQPSTGRFHQIRRHLNGLGHPVVGDATHGDTRFTRELVRDHSAPAGRLMLHCLRIRLGSLPAMGSKDWEDGETLDESDRMLRQVPLEGRESWDDDRVRNGLYNEVGTFCSNKAAPSNPGHSFCESARNECDWPSEQTTRAVDIRDGYGSRMDVPTAWFGEENTSIDADGGDDLDRSGGRTAGLDVVCSPPDDMMHFLRRMSWWEEGMLEAAERSGLL